MQKKLLILILILFFNSCNSKKDAVGDYNEIIIATSNDDKELIYPYLNSIFSKQINTPLKEEVFKVKWIDAENFFKYKYHNNIVIASLDNPPDKTGDKLFAKFNTAIENENIFAQYDMFSNNQVILNIGAFDSIELSDIVNINSSWIYSLFDEEINSRLFTQYKLNDLNIELNNMINDEFNLNFYIDENYHLIRKLNNFIWIGRGYPYRWITLHRSSGDINDENILNHFKSLVSNTMEDLIIVDNFFEIEYKNKIMIIRGLYEHDISDTGGPFFTYIIKNNKNNELNFISGFVNNPGKSKYYLLKQLESIISLNIKDTIR